MRSIRLFLLVASLPGLFLFSAPSAQAAGYWQDGYAQSCQPVFSTWSMTQTSVCYDITGYYNGSYRYYRVSAWSGDGSPGNISLAARYWICGSGPSAQYTYSGGGNWAATYSSAYYTGGCGHQADNFRSTAASNYWSAQTTR